MTGIMQKIIYLPVNGNYYLSLFSNDNTLNEYKQIVNYFVNNDKNVNPFIRYFLIYNAVFTMCLFQSAKYIEQQYTIQRFINQLFG